MLKGKYNETAKEVMSAEISDEVHGDLQWRPGGTTKRWSALAVNDYQHTDCRCYGQQKPDSNNKQNVNEHHNTSVK